MNNIINIINIKNIKYILIIISIVLISGCVNNKSNDSYNNEIFLNLNLPNNGTVVLDFYTDWCGYCKKLEPTMKKLENKGVIIVKVNGDKNRELVNKLGIRGYPTIIYVKNYSEIGRTIGYNPLEIEKKSLELFNIN